ncbi:hypothetical protein ABPG77_007806 [Micractinium sp. CCAP 211/92]
MALSLSATRPLALAPLSRFKGVRRASRSRGLLHVAAVAPPAPSLPNQPAAGQGGAPGARQAGSAVPAGVGKDVPSVFGVVGVLLLAGFASVLCSVMSYQAGDVINSVICGAGAVLIAFLAILALAFKALLALASWLERP